MRVNCSNSSRLDRSCLAATCFIKMKAEQKSAVTIGTPRISRLDSLDCFISGGKELKPLQLNTSHLEMLIWRPKGGPSSCINFRTEHKDDLGLASAPSSRYQAWNSRGQLLSLAIAVISTFSTREKTEDQEDHLLHPGLQSP